MANKRQRKRRKKEEKLRAISALSVCGYKCLISEQRMEIRPLTLLAGANSSGKSSMMQPLLLLKQTLEAPYDPGALLLDGPNVKITSADQLLSRSQGRVRINRFSVEAEIANEDRLRLEFRKEEREGLCIERMICWEDSGKPMEFSLGLPEEKVQKLVPAGLRRFMGRQPNTRWAIYRSRCFLHIGLHFGNGAGESVVDLGLSPIGPAKAEIASIIHLPGLRGNPERTYKTTAVGDSFPGTFEEYHASVISHWQRSQHEKLKLLGEALEHLGLSWKVEANQLDDTRVELRVGRLPHARRGGSKDLVSIADVGFGISQTLPVLVALLVARAGQIVYLEQPEIHLHPKAQAGMASLLAAAAKRGVRVVAETHSALLLLGVQTLVAKGQLDPALVKLHWFNRNPKDGATEVSSADLDENGAFGNDWPEDFVEVEMKADHEYLDAVSDRMFG